MFGFNSYTRPGKGIDKDEPEKKGIALFYDILMREFWHFCGINALFILGCLPIVTIGASYAALNSVIIKMIRDVPIYAFEDFKLGFKNNFKQGTIAMLINALIGVLVYIAYMFYLQEAPTLTYFVIAVAVLLLLFGNYVYPLLVSVELPLKGVYQNSFMIGMLCLFYSILNLVLGIGVFVLGVLMFPISIFYILTIGFAFSAFINCFITYKGIKRYAEPPTDIEDGEIIENTDEIIENINQIEEKND